MLQKQKECILNPSRIILMLYNMFLNDITKKISDEAVDRYPSTVELVPECCKSQEMCHRAVHRWFFVFDYIPDK